MLTLQGITYIHPNRDMLFNCLDLTINKQDKIALIGNNGIGKSTLLKIMAGELHPSSGVVKADHKLYHVPQIFGQFNDHTVAGALGIDAKLRALNEILEGNMTEQNLTLLDDDWTIEERCREAFAHWGLGDVDLSQQLSALSGGQKTKVFLAGIDIHRPEIVLLDEPSNHLDTASRSILYNYISNTKSTLVVVSHDRTLLSLLGTICELSKRGITVYGGNYDHYVEQKQIESEALDHDIKNKEKALRKAKETEREAMERQNKLDARGKKKQAKAGMPTIMMNMMRNKAEQSTSRMKGVHAEKIGVIAGELSQLRKEIPDIDKMKIDLDHSALHKGKVLITATDVNFAYHDQALWRQDLNFRITSGERLAIKGANGSGKTTLIRMILGELEPTSGSMVSSGFKAVHVDQDYSLIQNELSVYDQAQHFNSGSLQEHDIKIRLNRFLFSKEYWDKPCKALSGGEKMRLMLCCLAIGDQAPDMIILDEPTNNLDLQNVDILTSAINDHQGTIVAVSHDEHFLKQIHTEQAIVLR